jgi:hypothetical protein
VRGRCVLSKPLVFTGIATMRADIAALAEQIESAVALLRRRL